MLLVTSPPDPYRLCLLAPRSCGDRSRRPSLASSRTPSGAIRLRREAGTSICAAHQLQRAAVLPPRERVRRVCALVPWGGRSGRATGAECPAPPCRETEWRQVPADG